MPSSARFATFARVQLRAVVALAVPAAAALTLVLATQPAPAGTVAVTASDTTGTVQPGDGNDGFSWG
ncbi:hypothetical protein ACF07V_00015 [Streptomyces sp. NPDC015661]|uniref:hypothetical protein n=1 Tax=Streptomyces sp. NPDC015661 TaxID=3364961 RepID=UPI0036F8A588